MILPLRIRRNHSIKTDKTIQTINTTMFSLGLNSMNYSNIFNSDIGRRGLHLSEKRVTKLASSIIGKSYSL